MTQNNFFEYLRRKLLHNIGKLKFNGAKFQLLSEFTTKKMIWRVIEAQQKSF